MEDAAYNVTRSNMLLNSGDVRLLGRPTANSTERPTYRPFYQQQADGYFQNFPKSAQLCTPQDSTSPFCFLNPADPPNNSIPFQVTSTSTSSFHNLNMDSWRLGLRPESDSAFRIFPRAPGASVARSDSDLSLFDPISAPSSPDSPCHSFRTAAERYPQMTLRYKTNSVYTQTERSPFEEKFLFRESILLGCDLVTELAQRLPSVAEVREHAEYVREKTIQSRAQNVCSRMTIGGGDQNIISEYVKTFIKIADSWLDARNCFGLAGRCSSNCCLDVRDLPGDYIEWMHSSRQLLNTIVMGLEKMTLFNSKESTMTNTIPQALPEVKNGDLQVQLPVSCAGQWGYPPNPSCHCMPPAPRPAPVDGLQHNVRTPNFPVQTEPPPWYQNQQFALYPSGPPLPYLNVDTSESASEYLKPSSYDVPRKNMTLSKKRSNITRAKSDAFQDKAIFKGYVVALPNTATKRDSGAEDQEEPESSQRKNERENITSDRENSISKNPREWIISNFENNVGKKSEQVDEKELDSDSDDECDEADNSPSRNSLSRNNQHWRTGKNVWSHAKRRRSLNQPEVARIQEIVRILWKYDLPESVKFTSKDSENLDVPKALKQSISLESIANKMKNNIYETVEQFIHDSRRIFLNAASHCQKNKLEKEKVAKQRADFENLLEEHFDNIQNWNHISGDAKEVNYYPELKYSNTRKKPRAPKNAAICDTPDNGKTEGTKAAHQFSLNQTVE